jgi:hypothetical protein
MTGEWEEKKGQKQTDRWSGKVMQLKRVEFHRVVFDNELTLR